jgi:putative heme transporter
MPDNPSEQSSKALTRVSVRIAAPVLGLILIVAALLYIVVNARTGFTFIAIAAFLAAALNHPVHWLERHRLPRWSAIATVMAAIAGVLVGVFLLLVPAVVKQLQALIDNGPSIIASIRQSSLYRTLDAQLNFTAQIQRAESELPQALQKSVNPALKAVSSVLTSAVGFITVFFLTIFMLIFGGSLVEAALGEAMPANRVRYQRVLSKIYDSVGGYLAGMSLICVVNATVTTIVLAILGVPFFLPLGILSGFSSLVPYAGPVVMAAAVTLLTLATSGWVKAIAVAVYYVLYGQLEGNVLGPVVFRRTVNINPLISLMALVVFGELGGIGGAIAAVPLAAMGQIIVRELLVLRRQRLNLPLTGEVGSVEDLPGGEVKRLAEEEAAHQQAGSGDHH